MNTCPSIFDESAYQYRQLFYPNTTSVEFVNIIDAFFKRQLEYNAQLDMFIHMLVELMCWIFCFVMVLMVITCGVVQCVMWASDYLVKSKTKLKDDFP